jgi:hypothetical protein
MEIFLILLPVAVAVHLLLAAVQLQLLQEMEEQEHLLL